MGDSGAERSDGGSGGWPGLMRWPALALLACALAACGGSSTHTTPTGTASYQTLVDAGAHLLRQGNVQAAQQLFGQAIAKDRAGTVAHYDLGVVYQQLGEIKNALRQYNAALVSDRSYVPALYNEATLVSAHNAPLAIFYYRQVIHFRPDSPTAFLNLGLLESQTKALHRQALKDLERAIRLDPALRGSIPTALRRQLPATTTS